MVAGKGYITYLLAEFDKLVTPHLEYLRGILIGERLHGPPPVPDLEPLDRHFAPIQRLNNQAPIQVQRFYLDPAPLYNQRRGWGYLDFLWGR